MTQDQDLEFVEDEPAGELPTRDIAQDGDGDRWTSDERRANALVQARLARESPDRVAQRLRRLKWPERDVEAVHAQLVTDLVWRLRGIVVGEWACHCGERYTAASYPRERCACGRAYPVRCASPGCPRVVEPIHVRTSTDFRFDVPSRAGELWDLPDHRQCATCVQDVPYRSRLRAWAASDVPAEKRAIATTSYWRLPERETFFGELARWIERNLGRELGPCSLYLWSQTKGTGKTLGAALAAYTAQVERGLVAAVTWTSQSALRKLHDRFWQRGTDKAIVQSEQAGEALQRVADAHFLVVDELFSAPVRGAFAERLSDLVRDRLEARLPTIYTSNKPPLWSAELEGDGRIDSRWCQLGVTLEIEGTDWRRV